MGYKMYTIAAQKLSQVSSALFLITAYLVINGCTALQPFPNVARAGDTLTLAVGSPLDMTRANTTATFTSDIDGVPIDITPNIRSVFKLYADPASKVYETTAVTDDLVFSSNHSPWITIVAVDLPQGLQVGTGIVEINTTATYPNVSTHINDLDLPVEIIAGTGSPNSFTYEFGVGSQLVGDLTSLESQPIAVFGPTIPSVACPCPDYAAIEVTATIPTSLGSLNQNFVKVIPEDLTVATISGRNFIQGINGQDLTVIFTSNTEKLKYYEAQFTVALHSTFSFTGTPTINSVRYFDINGNEVSGPVADYSVSVK